MAIVLKRDAVLQNWNTLVTKGAGHGKKLLDQINVALAATKIEGIHGSEQDVTTGGIFGEKRNFLVVGHSKLREYNLFINARDYGTNLDVSWYLTLRPTGLKRTISKYTTGNPQALSMHMNVFSQQDLSAFVSVVHNCVKDAVQALYEELELDPAGLNTQSKGFLNVW